MKTGERLNEKMKHTEIGVFEDRVFQLLGVLRFYFRCLREATKASAPIPARKPNADGSGIEYIETL